MRILFAIAFVLSCNIVFAQQPFQGTIIYNMKASHEKEEAQLTAQFAPNKIKLKFKEKEKFDDTYILIDLDSGKIFTVNTENKNYRSKKLPVSDTIPQQTLTSKTIAGYPTDPVITNDKGMPFTLGGLFGGRTSFFVAKDLYFPIPKKYANVNELIIIQNDRIVLGAEMRIASPFMESSENDSAKQVIITAEAQSVEKKNFNINEFLIPADYTAFSFNWPMTDSVVMSDSTYVTIDSVFMSDTTSMEPPPPPPVKKTTTPKPTTPKKTTPPKGEATKPKKKQ